MADAPNEPKADLKSRLGLKPRAAPSAAPIVPGAPPPEPPKPKFEKPTAATIDEARRLAAQAEKDAGPAIEQFQFGAPETTPLPSALPSAPRVEYIEIKGGDDAEGAKKRRLQLILACVAAGLVAFVVGRMMGSQSVRSSINESVLLEAQEKQKLFESKKPTFDNIAKLRGELEKLDAQLRVLDPKKDDITALEKDFTNLIVAMGAFSVNKQSSLDPAEVMSGTLVNGELMKSLGAFAYQTRSFQEAVTAAVEEAKALFTVSPTPSPDWNTMSTISEPGDWEVEGIGKVPVTKGVRVLQIGKPEAVQGKDAEGNPMAEYYVKAKLAGRDEIVQVKSTQVVQVDMTELWANFGKASKAAILTRLADITMRLLDQVKKIDPKAIQAEIQQVITPTAAEK